MMFGRDPRLPVDHLLDSPGNAHDDQPDVDVWVADHQERLQQAFDLAGQRAEATAVSHSHHFNRKAGNTGRRAFLRNHGTQDPRPVEPHPI